MLPEKDQAMATRHQHKQFSEDGPAVPEIRLRTDRHTHRQTD